jgi:carbon-monoxide dehydrogenase small subunit
MTVRHAVRLTVNGREYEGSVEARQTLLDFLREALRLTGPHVGCEHCAGHPNGGGAFGCAHPQVCAGS